jgi:hypothetical protein
MPTILDDRRISELGRGGVFEGDIVPGTGGGTLLPDGSVRGGTSPQPQAQTFGADVFDSPAFHAAGGVGAPEQTIGEALGTFQAPAADVLDESRFIPRDVNVDQIRRNTMRQFQGEIDAANRVYDQLLNEARIEGQGRLGSARAIAGRSGTLGSDFGAAQKEQVLGQNLGIERSIGAERGAAIAAIMGRGRAAAAEEIAAKRAALQSGVDNYITFLGAKTERDAQNLSNLTSSLIAQGFDPSEMDPEEIAAIAESYGTDTGTILSSYSTARAEADAAEAAAAREGQFNLSEGQARFDAQGNVIAQRAKTFKPTAGTGSRGIGAGLDVSNLTEGILQGVAGLKDLTPSQRGDVISEIIASGRGQELKDQFTGFADAKKNTIIEFVDKALTQFTDAEGNALLRVGSSKIPGTDSFDFNQTLETIKANIGFNELQEMRAASPTGGALGQVSERELSTLQAVLGSLDIGQSDAQITENLNKIRESVQKWGDAVRQANVNDYGTDVVGSNTVIGPDGQEYELTD